MGNSVKQQLGKLEINTPLDQLIQQQREQNDLKILSIELEHILGIDELPFHHKDPFDRLLISQAKHEDAVLAIRCKVALVVDWLLGSLTQRGDIPLRYGPHCRGTAITLESAIITGKEQADAN